MKQVSILLFISLLISGCKAKGESIMTVGVTSQVTDTTVCFILKDTSISDDSWPKSSDADDGIARCAGSDEIKDSYHLTTDTNFEKLITCFYGDTICFGGGSTGKSWGVGITGDRDEYDKDVFCTSCATKSVTFTLTNSNSDEGESDDDEETPDEDSGETDNDKLTDNDSE
ncbi:hypothetical protein KAH37_03120 [bacterium]|nr:hypothetical protein [bacterium]